MIDTEFEEVRLVSVERQKGGWDITREDGWSFWVPEEYGVEPKPGQVARFYGRGIGAPVRGLALDGQIVWYRTAEEQREQWEREQAARDAQRRQEATQQEPEAAARIAVLPEPFRQRIEGFRQRNPDFWWEHQPYELFVCEQAVAFAEALETPSRLGRFGRMTDEKRMRELVPAYSDQHSGNTFGAAVRLAMLFLERPELVPQEHGALCPLVGCREYGCWAARS